MARSSRASSPILVGSAPSFVTPATKASIVAFALAIGAPLLAWQAEAYGAATQRAGGRFVHRLAGISVPRGDGKSWADAMVGLWRLVCGDEGTDIISSALDLEGARVVLDHAKRIMRGNDDLAAMIEERSHSLLLKDSTSKWTVTSSEHTASRGRHPDLVLYDEIGWAKDDDLYSSLLAGQAPVSDPLMIVSSTVGKRRSGPLWQLSQMVQEDESVFWYHHSTNQNPRVTKEFLARQKRILMPQQYAREHENTWIDGQDSFTCSAEVDAAMTSGHHEEFAGRRDVRAAGFVDLGTVKDPSVVCVGYIDPLNPSRVKIGRLVTFQGTQQKPVRIADVEDCLKQLLREWSIFKIRVESWQGVASVQRLQDLRLPVELFAPTAKAHSEEWPQLAQRLAQRTLDLFPHERLRDELLNLSYDVGPTGVRVTDRGRIHQDHAVAVRGVVSMLGSPQRRYPSSMQNFDGEWI